MSAKKNKMCQDAAIVATGTKLEKEREPMMINEHKTITKSKTKSKALQYFEEQK